jgi:DNA-binding beta-propeller fold protein YncE
LISGPSGLIYDTQRQRLLVSNYISGTIVSIDLNGKSRLLVSDLQKPYSLFLEEQSNQLYVSEQGKNVVSIIDLNSVSN